MLNSKREEAKQNLYHNLHYFVLLIGNYYFFINYTYFKFYMYLKYYKLYDYTYESSFSMTDLLFSLYVHKLYLSNVERSSLVNFLMVVPNVLQLYCFWLHYLSTYSLLLLFIISHGFITEPLFVCFCLAIF